VKASDAVRAPGCRVFAADWAVHADAIRSIRAAVFVGEQGVPLEVEQDGRDPACLHVLAVNEAGAAIGTGRLLGDHIGRLAVLREARGSGIGGALLQALLRLARDRGLREVALNAQLHALAFYERHGFRPRGEVFHEGGIGHREMVLRLA
jgi:predicted GNAT family N-acyltransferase